ncbi:hypothetical protein AAH991_02440 [Microbispora sp. ZYX-F-249]|uniref:Uncharacterized protein n=1 Tax=Microbispora maris TaxID=3144104 RepID=A0ABV0AF21_9ACTN
MAVIHRERVAWESARVFVAAATDDAYWWLGETLGRHLGQTYELDLKRTRLRLRRDDAPRAGRAHEDALSAEVAAWRARIEDVLTEHPEIAPVLRQVTEETRDRLRR